jgi:hypothetical protein
MTLLLALTLVLDPAPQPQRFPSAPPPAVEATHPEKLRSWAWIPAGLLLGQESRHEDNEKGRTSTVILDVIGSIALGFGYAASHYRLTP